jgi:hypothetical protein
VQSATGQNAIPPPSGVRRDAIADAQTPREVPKERPEQNKTPHDLSDVFAPSKASPSSEALIEQPESGGKTGFDFYRDPLGAMKPGTTFEEIDNAAVANKPTASARQRKLLESRYNLEPRLDPKATMSRGKPLVVGPTARLPQGTGWAMLGASGAIRPKGRPASPTIGSLGDLHGSAMCCQIVGVDGPTQPIYVSCRKPVMNSRYGGWPGIPGGWPRIPVSPSLLPLKGVMRRGMAWSSSPVGRTVLPIALKTPGQGAKCPSPAMWPVEATARLAAEGPPARSRSVGLFSVETA